MTQQVVTLILLAGFCLTSALAWQCDNGKFQLERDLPHSLLHCSKSYRGNYDKQFYVDQKSSQIEPAKHVCMDTPIIYNATIPSSGDHRPVAAESGVYLYCPPQRWLNNAQHGSIVALYHPCAPERQQGRLAALAQACLPGYIMTPYPWLNMDMPLALVSWGRTLEMSHVTAPEVCDWLISVSPNFRQLGDTKQRPGKRYSLLLTHAAPQHRPKDTLQDTHTTTSQIDWLKSLRSCCEETLSKHKDGDTQRERRDERSQRRERRGVLRAQEESPPDTPLSNVTDLYSTHTSKLNDRVAPSTSVPLEIARAATAAPMQSTAKPPVLVTNVSSPAQMKEQAGAEEPKEEKMDKEEKALRTQEQVGAGEPKEEKKEEAPRTQGQVGAGEPKEDKEEEASKTQEQVGAGEPKEEKMEKEASKTQEQEGWSGGGGGGGGGGGQEQKKVINAPKTRSRTHSSHTHTHGQTHRKAGTGAGVGVSADAGGASSPRQRVREDTEEQQRLEERETKAPEMGAGSRGSAAVDRLPTPRTDEAVWAAAALGFLLVLLTLSVLHTRLYRHWRTTPSLYWHHSAQDYDSVADVIRRRLKLAGRRKRRVAPGRRHEAPLIPNSSAEEESD